MAVAFSQKVLLGNIILGSAVGNSRSGKWLAASQVMGRISAGSPVDRAPNSSFTHRGEYPVPCERIIVHINGRIINAEAYVDASCLCVLLQNRERFLSHPLGQFCTSGFGPFVGLAVCSRNWRVAHCKLGDDLANIVGEIDVFRETLNNVVALRK